MAGRGGRNRSDALEAPFVGRDEELRALKDLYAATGRERRPRLVSVIGPAGIGKTRLAWEFLKYLDGLADPAWWHAGRSPAYGDGITFWALGEMVRGRAGLAEGDDEATTRARIAETVRTHVSDPAEAAWIEPALLALLGVETGVGSDELFAAWRTFFERLADTAPVVLVFEDLQHADPGLLDFIDHVMEWSRGVPITIIALARPELLERRPDWGAGLRSFTSIHLEPLPPADMERLLAGLVPGLPAAATAAIVARADGVPCTPSRPCGCCSPRDAWCSRTGCAGPQGPSTRSRSPRPSRRSSPRASTAWTQETGPWSPMPRSWAELQPSRPSPRSRARARPSSQPRLRGLVRRELLALDVDPRSPGRGQYAFVQALVREVAYHTLSRRDRRLRHLAAARYLETLGTDEIAGALADHYQAAYRNTPPGPEADALAAQARVALRAAAERATALGSHAQAVAFLEQALEITTDPADRAALHAERTRRRGREPRHRRRGAPRGGRGPERRRAGDREAIAWPSPIGRGDVRVPDPERALAIATEAWAEFSDLEQTPAGVRLMGAIAWTYLGSRRRRRGDALVRPAPADRGATRAPRGDGGWHPRTGRVTAHHGPAPGGHGPPARGPPARGRERPAR